MRMIVVTMRKMYMRAKMRKLFQTLKLLNVLQSVYHGWKDRTMLTLTDYAASKNDATLDAHVKIYLDTN